MLENVSIVLKIQVRKGNAVTEIIAELTLTMINIKITMIIKLIIFKTVI